MASDYEGNGASQNTVFELNGQPCSSLAMCFRQLVAMDSMRCKRCCKSSTLPTIVGADTGVFHVTHAGVAEGEGAAGVVELLACRNGHQSEAV